MSNITYLPTPYSYSSAVVAGDYAFIALHRGFGDDFVSQFHGAMAGLKETLARLELPLTAMVKVHVWLKTVQDLPTMEKLFLDYFPPEGCPARMTATTEFFDRDCLLMIEGTAYCRR